MQDIIQDFHQYERKIFPHLAKHKTLSDIAKASRLQQVEVMRALQWLSNKKILTIRDDDTQVIDLAENGKTYQKIGLPEIRFLKSLTNDPTDIAQIAKKASLKPDEINICIGILKSKAAIELKKEKTLTVKKTKSADQLLKKQSLEEQFLKNEFPLKLANLKPEQQFAYQQLSKRKEILQLKTIKSKNINLTDFGKKLVKQKISLDHVEDRLTHQMLKNGSWKKKTFRGYDVSINVPQIHGGKQHFVSQAVEYIRKIWLELGFSEMTGSMVQTSFWDLDSLFVPQDHPARAMQDTFYIKDPKKGILPPVAKKVKEVHENGANTNSSGWGGIWSQEIARENLLRTHTTVLSAQTLSKLKESEIPAKFFSVGKVFRNEALDYKHLFEFYQVEGIVVDPSANFKHLLGYLREFFTKMGYADVRIRPGHFPYTEPSAEVDVLNPKRNEWIELGGSGIFRPELTTPLLGKEIPVLAWGLGLGRIISEYWNITDIRELYKNDVKQLREIKDWMK